MKHIDLFSGIGGFAYAAQQVWGDDYENVLFCDIDKFCQAVLRKNFGEESLIYGDIKEITRERVLADTNQERQLQSKGSEQEQRGRSDNGIEQIDLLTGSPPCQPFSCAGKRRGTADDRHLWGEMFRVIQEFNPRFIIAENVRGLISIEDGVVFETMCADLESIGYAVQTFIIPACAKGAPHRRDRVWIVGHLTDTANTGAEGMRQERKNAIHETTQNPVRLRDRGRDNGDSTGCERPLQTPRPDSDDTDPKSRGLSESGTSRHRGQGFKDGNINDTDAECTGLQGSNERTPSRTESKRFIGHYNREWEQSWIEVATELCRVDDGIPAVMDGLELSAAKHRTERLKSLGNAIVPQIAMELMRAIKDCMGDVAL